ncbi:MAG: gamma-glutamylcyclotransferase [Gammaproteobacteria bacterium]
MRLFCYGTLQFPDVLHAVTGDWFSAEPAVLDDYACYLVRGEVFPGIVARQGAATTGVVYTGLGVVQLRKLDVFEGDFYVRRRVCVRSATGNPLQVWTYAVAARHCRRLTRDTWDREVFEMKYLQQFLRSRRG